MNKIFILWFFLLSTFIYADQGTTTDNNLGLSSEQNTINTEKILDDIDKYYPENERFNDLKDRDISNNSETADVNNKENPTYHNYDKETENKVTTDVDFGLKQNKKGGLNKNIGLGTDYKYKDMTLSGQIDLNVKSNKKKGKKQKSNYNSKIGVDLEYDF